jgi:integrase
VDDGEGAITEGDHSRVISINPENLHSADMGTSAAGLGDPRRCGGLGSKKPEDVLFSSPNGEPIRLANWRQRVWDPAVAAAGLTGLTPHDLRHTAASLAIASGASVKHIQRMLGHKDAAMTLNVYASLFEDDLDYVSDRLDAALLEAAAASVRPEPSAEVIELPDQTA